MALATQHKDINHVPCWDFQSAYASWAASSSWNPWQLHAEIPHCCWPPPHYPQSQTHILKHLKLCLYRVREKQQQESGEPDSSESRRVQLSMGSVDGQCSRDKSLSPAMHRINLAGSPQQILLQFLPTAALAAKPGAPVQLPAQPSCWHGTQLLSGPVWHSHVPRLTSNVTGWSCIRYDWLGFQKGLILLSLELFTNANELTPAIC